MTNTDSASDSQDARNRPRLVGISIMGPPPLGRLFLSFREPSCQVLYGLNGAGKTRILTALSDAFQGIAPQDGVAVLHFEDVRTAGLDWGDPTEELGDPLSEVLFFAAERRFQSLQREAVFFQAGRNENVQYAYDSRETDMWTFERLAQEIVELMLRYRYGFSNDAVLAAAEVAKQGLFSLIARGDRDSPSWDVYVSARLSSDTVVLPEAVETLRASERESLFRELPTLTLDDPIAWDEPLVLFQAGSNNFSELLPAMVAEGDTTDEEVLRFIEGPSGLLAAHDGAVVVDSETTRRKNNLEKAVNVVLTDLWAEPFRMRCVVRDPQQWAYEGALYWEALDAATAEWVSAEDLSYAQRRWAQLSIRLAIALSGRRPVSSLIIDEPERALDRAAERGLIEGLVRYAERMRFTVLCATHSPEALNHPKTKKLHVQRDESGRTRLQPLALDVAALSDLGLSLADLLQGVRYFLLVEGTHDEIVLETLLASDFERCRVDVLPLQGFTDEQPLMHVVNSEFLFKYTSATVIVVLDNAVDGSRLERVWTSVRNAYRQHPPGALGTLHREFGDMAKKAAGAGKGLKHLRSLCESALAKKMDGRVEIFGFSKGDIIEYLPVNKLVPGDASWSELRAEWEQVLGRPDFKEWLRRSRQADINRDSIRAAVETMDEIPPELEGLRSLYDRKQGAGIAQND